jgi:hypothetical protein
MIHQFLEISTAHISPSARIWLNEQADLNNADGGYNECWHVASHVHGWWVFAGETEEKDDMRMLHSDLLQVCEYARSKQCYFVLFDGDGEQIDALPVYEWGAA